MQFLLVFVKYTTKKLQLLYLQNCVSTFLIPVSLVLTNSHSSSLKFFNTIHGLPRTKTIIIMDKQHMKMGLFCQHLF